ncbi:MAG: leucyl aminopeptidase [Deltaproteobacteria bacterium HGW-Deltaproteobacteria-14]|jgi:leucyl aminopeptidase|nr:MAG: leucyl aminopeptidase [Deltaproteobacteria bacterium HGW-Deltaproteobacteria-14]
MRVALPTSRATEVETPLLAVPVFADEGGRGADFDAVDQAAGGLLGRIADEEGFKAEPGKSLLVHANDGPAQRYLLLGAGKRAEFAPKELRGLAAAACDEANARHLTGCALVAPEGLDAAASVHFATLGAVLASYRYHKYLTRDVEATTCERMLVAVAGADAKALERVAARATRAAEAVNLARDLVNGPPREITPTRLAEVASEIAAAEGLEVRILDESAIAEQGMNLLTAVGSGSDEPPRFIHLTWRPEGADANTPSIALVGKGITFDAGGYNIKPTGSMEDMKMDMAGAAAVLGAMKAVAAFAPKYVVHGIVPTCENLVSGSAYKPGDVFHAKNGKSVEIMNTDAEGRLVLADALTYAAELGVGRIVDLATLTGACMVALGPHTAGLMGNDDGFRDKVAGAAARAGEDVWPLPLTKKLKAMLKSPIADMKNVGERWGGALTAGIFLSEFVGDVTWAHLDIAGPAYTEKPEPSVAKGGTGFGVLTLLELLDGEV